MKKLLLTVALLALAFSNAYAEEEEGEETGSNRTKTPPSVEDIDTDGDGLVSQEEFNQFRQGDDGDEEEGDDSEQERDGLRETVAAAKAEETALIVMKVGKTNNIVAWRYFNQLVISSCKRF
ncbi:hypothetical protein L1D13_22445 [Vibrio tubiashii]|uniref:hypothetical protein n=1 Tax=Vibrio tubiashii TaxID=29498 RepID=UPI001EFD9DCC|nr:hypothetical protein [Vibrio tubiashii]MCG9582431.1 hypothetical protein [Vibrio tubiashii]MCG9616022.1 hypothetical protein [Vibrio tubiashii]MCG9689664.1 hypothetical protein [Vibrio tubiashii]